MNLLTSPSGSRRYPTHNTAMNATSKNTVPTIQCRVQKHRPEAKKISVAAMVRTPVLDESSHSFGRRSGSTCHNDRVAITVSARTTL